MKANFIGIITESIWDVRINNAFLLVPHNDHR